MFRDRQIVAPAFLTAVHGHLRRWAGRHVAGLIVPAALRAAAREKGEVTIDKIAPLTAIIFDLGSGDIAGKAAYGCCQSNEAGPLGGEFQIL